MSKVLNMANGDTTLWMSFDIELYDLFDEENLPEDEKEEYELCLAFTQKYGEVLDVQVFAEIDEGYSEYAGYGAICLGRNPIDEAEIPGTILGAIESSAESYAESEGLDSFLG